MPYQPTPIGFYSCATVPAEFARDLERELDAANRRIEELMRRNSVEETVAVGKGI